MTVDYSTILRSSDIIFNISKIEVNNSIRVSEIVLEELLEKRDFYLYTIKHLEFRRIDESNPNETQKLMEMTFAELKKIENEIRNILNQKSI